MGRVLLVARLALRDLTRRRTETALLLVVLLAATTTLTLGLVLRDAASEPYLGTREATAGPDVVAAVSELPGLPPDGGLPALEALARSAEVVGSSGPFPVAAGRLTTPDGRESDVQAVGRDARAAEVDRPALLAGAWTRPGGVVVEAAFADAMGLSVGDDVTLGGRDLDVVGIAVTAAAAPYPQATCFFGCLIGAVPDDLPAEQLAGMLQNPGLVWLTVADASTLADASGMRAWVANLRLDAGVDVREFVAGHSALDGPLLRSWLEVRADATEQALDAQIILVFGSSLLGLLAIASVAVLVGGRMAEQTRRVGLLKAVGGTPGLVVSVLLVEYVAVGVVAAAIGLLVGSLLSPVLAGTAAGLIGAAGPPALTWTTALVVTGAALTLAVAATLVPALRAARTSTLSALADAARPPRRTGWLIRASAHLPPPLLLAVRVAARRPRRLVLGTVSIVITVSGLVVALALRGELARQQAAGGIDAARMHSLMRVVVIVTVVLFCLAAINALFLTWATALDSRRPSALARALGATPRDVAAALAGAQVLPALVGALLGAVPGSLALFAVINLVNDGDNDATLPPGWEVAALVAGVVLAVAALTAVPARLAARRSVADALRVDDA